MNLSIGMPVSADVLGVRVDCVTMNETLERCAQFLDTAGHHQVATLNPEFVMLAQRDARFRALVREASLVVPDGAGIVWALRRQGITNVERVTGIDLMREICAQAAISQVPVFLLGAGPGIAATGPQKFCKGNFRASWLPAPPSVRLTPTKHLRSVRRYGIPGQTSSLLRLAVPPKTSGFKTTKKRPARAWLWESAAASTISRAKSRARRCGCEG